YRLVVREKRRESRQSAESVDRQGIAQVPITHLQGGTEVVELTHQVRRAILFGNHGLPGLEGLADCLPRTNCQPEHALKLAQELSLIDRPRRPVLVPPVRARDPTDRVPERQGLWLLEQ